MLISKSSRNDLRIQIIREINSLSKLNLEDKNARTALRSGSLLAIAFFTTTN